MRSPEKFDVISACGFCHSRKLLHVVLASLLLLLAESAGASSHANSATETDPAILTTNAIIDFAITHQTMQGFGASDAFLDQPLTDAQADMYFTTTSGIGLSWLRLGIASNGGLNGGAWSDATKAAARGAQIWAAPWSAPAAWKDNNSELSGGHLCAAAGQTDGQGHTCSASHYDDWASRLAAFAGLLQQNAGVPLYGILIQNEPDYIASYVSMLVSNSEFVNFINVLGPKLAALNPKPVLIAGDYSDWANLWGMTAAIEANSSALAYTGIYATHQYWRTSTYQGSHPRPLWQSEMSSFEAFDPSIANGVTVAKWIHAAIVDGNVSVWHYWWLYNPYNESNEGLIGYPENRNASTKRFYTLGNFSKFVRPGWVRIDVSGQSNPNLFVSAYKGPLGKFAIVVINDSASNQSFVANLADARVPLVVPWSTSATLDLAAQASVAVSANQFSAIIPNGVTTFVGTNDLIFASGMQ